MKPAKLSIILVSILLALFLTNKISESIRMRAVSGAQIPPKLRDQILKKINLFETSSGSERAETKKAEVQIKILEARLALLNELTVENKRLKALLNFRQKVDYQTIPAEVIGRDPSNWTSIVYIDKGTKDGIVKNMGVITPDGIVGRVVETGPSSAKVMLINDPDSRVAATVQKSRHDGLLRGTMSYSLNLVYLSPDADINVGDVIVTSDSGRVFFEGLLVGSIVDIFDDKSRLYRTAVIKPSADLGRLEEVLCIK